MNLFGLLLSGLSLTLTFMQNETCRGWDATLWLLFQFSERQTDGLQGEHCITPLVGRWWLILNVLHLKGYSHATIYIYIYKYLENAYSWTNPGMYVLHSGKICVVVFCVCVFVLHTWILKTMQPKTEFRCSHLVMVALIISHTLV